MFSTPYKCFADKRNTCQTATYWLWHRRRRRRRRHQDHQSRDLHCARCNWIAGGRQSGGWTVSNNDDDWVHLELCNVRTIYTKRRHGWHLIGLCVKCELWCRIVVFWWGDGLGRFLRVCYYLPMIHSKKKTYHWALMTYKRDVLRDLGKDRFTYFSEIILGRESFKKPPIIVFLNWYIS